MIFETKRKKAEGKGKSANGAKVMAKRVSEK
jgi:hypothetical protein